MHCRALGWSRLLSPTSVRTGTVQWREGAQRLSPLASPRPLLPSIPLSNFLRPIWHVTSHFSRQRSSPPLSSRIFNGPLWISASTRFSPLSILDLPFCGGWCLAPILFLEFWDHHHCRLDVFSLVDAGKEQSVWFWSRWYVEFTILSSSCDDDARETKFDSCD